MADAVVVADAPGSAAAPVASIWRRRFIAVGTVAAGIAAAGVLASVGFVQVKGPDWYTQLPPVAQAWLGAVWPEPNWQRMAQGDFLDEVRQRGTLVVAVREYPRPAPPSAPTPPEPDGFDADMAQFIADRLGVRLKLVGLKARETGEAYEPPSEPVDLVVAGTGVAHILGGRSAATQTPQAPEPGAVPTRYSDASTQLMVLRGSPIHTSADLRQRSVCLQRGSSQAHTLATALGVVPRSYPSGVHAVYAFMSGECDALAEDESLVQRLVKQEEWRFYRPVPAQIPLHDDSPEIVLSPKVDAVSARYLNAVVRYWHIGGAQAQAREQRAGNLSFELMQLQNGMICHS